MLASQPIHSEEKIFQEIVIILFLVLRLTCFPRKRVKFDTFEHVLFAKHMAANTGGIWRFLVRQVCECVQEVEVKFAQQLTKTGSDKTSFL